MNLTIPPETKVFRVVYPTHKGEWHLFVASVPNGFTPKTHPSFPLWHNTFTHKGFCGRSFDDRAGHGFRQDAKIEWSTVGEIKKICPSCFPYSKIANQPDHISVTQHPE